MVLIQNYQLKNESFTDHSFFQLISKILHNLNNIQDPKN